MKVLLIEDDRILGESLKEYLEQNSFDVDWLIDDRKFEYYFNLKEYDVILLDLMLKFKKGEDILKSIKNKKDVPVIVTTAKYLLKDKERCFMLGADDYVVKPFEPKELVLRIKSVVRRYSKVDKRVVIDDVIIDFDRHKLMKGKENYTLTKREMDLLFILCKNRGNVVSNECILSYVWGDSVVGSDSVRTYIKRLRKLIGEEKIETIKGVGYLLK
ncbi:response regulator transcription factor [Deferribacter abyssi]|uniref:response regulator transcription factor n=1 Tax=Deferribacter abyssi TaxID=213806 RepID=UPI003C1EC7BD